MTAPVVPTGKDPGAVGVSLILPCLNEAAHIEDCLTSLVEGDYPADLLEILVLDGLSTDGTREILAELSKKWPQIRVIDNPGASKPKGLNLGIKAANNNIVMRIDGHARYADNYIRDLVKYLHIYEADNVGGVRLNRTRGAGVIAKLLASVLTHPFGVGDAKHYTGTSQVVESDIIFLFCARKRLFEEVGNFNEALVRGQDREFNLRLNRLGRRMLLCPDVTSTYFTREKISAFARWAFQSGKAPYDVSRIVGENLLSVRNVVPPAFSAAVLALPVLGFWQPFFWSLFVFMMGLYVLLGFAAAFAMPSKDQSALMKLMLPAGFFLWHFTYGLGAIRGLAEWTIKSLKIHRVSSPA